MPEHDFIPLYRHYPTVIAQMPQTFTSHQFILRVAQQYQREYIEALYSYRNVINRGNPAPFSLVHRMLSQGLREFPGLVTYDGEVPSTDIFGRGSKCPQWRKR